MADARVISISELLQLGRPLTGAASLSLRPALPQPSSSPSLKHAAAGTTLIPEGEPVDPSAFHPLNFPVVLVGTLGLSTDDASPACTSRNHCFSFSDGSARVCCAILDLDIAALGCEINVLAWNFLPLQRGGGVLEVIRWSLPNPALRPGPDPFPSAPPRFPRLEDRSGARSCAWGLLVSVSPVFSVPLRVQDGGCEGDPHREAAGGAHLVGFLTEVSTCKCNPCTEARSLEDLHRCLQGRNSHSFSEPVFVYFRGHSSSWRPVLSKLAGNVVLISSLKKKYVSAGGRESLVFATTGRTVVYKQHIEPLVDNVFVKRRPHLGNGQLGTYCGVVTGIFKKGMVVELDKKDVWLLFTDPLLDLPHSLRVGAVITAKNVHFVRPNFSWIRVLLLGGCARTTVEVKSFSPFDTRCHFMNRSHSLLWDFIDSLPFSARFWVLLLISSFQKKFSGILSDKEILGSKKKEGLVQTYCKSSLPSIMFEHQLGAFEDFCKHDLCSCRNNFNCPPLRLVVPMSNFVTKCKTIWMSMLSQVQVDSMTKGGNNNVSLVYCQGKYHHGMMRRIMSSKELGLVLVGSLQVSPSSGRLQLVDSTGCVDVAIPDLSPNFDQHIIYEDTVEPHEIHSIYESILCNDFTVKREQVKDYTVIIRGFPVQLDPMVLHQSDPLSCRSILQHFQLHEGLHGLMVYVHFYIRNLRCLKTPYPAAGLRIGDAMGSGGGHFHLLLVTHKFLHIQNLPGHSSSVNKPSAFAEAILLPYNLHLLGKYQDIQPAGVSGRLECADDIPCVITFTEVTYQGYLVPCNFSHRDGSSVDTSADKQVLQRVLLEFNFGSINKYQQLCIGTYYIFKPSKEELSYSTKGHAELLDSATVVVTSQTCLWSLMFSPGMLLHPCMWQPDQPSRASAVEDDVSPLRDFCQSEKLFHHYADMNHKNLDALLHLTGKALIKNCLSKAYKTLGEEFTVSSFIQIMASMSLKPSRSFNHESRLPEGNLISLRGNIMDVHVCHHNHPEGRVEWSHKCSGNCTICIHVHQDHHMVKVRGTFGISVYPLGMGPGANATFHRVLPMLRYGLMMIPVSFIVVHYVEQPDVQNCSRNLFPLSKRFMSSSSLGTKNESLPVISLGLISELTDYFQDTKVHLHCRVTGVFILLLEEQANNPKNSQSAGKSKLPAVRISLAGFILDDGSSSCCCWADCDRAEMLLQLQETAFQSVVSSHRTSKLMGNNQRQVTVGNNQRQVTVGNLLKKMLKKHRRITIQNFVAKIDSSFMDTSFSVDSNKALTSSEEDVLRFIILNAQNGPNLNVAGYMLNPNELPWSEEEFIKTDFAEQPIMKHLWAEEIGLANALMDGRNLIKELLAR